MRNPKNFGRLLLFARQGGHFISTSLIIFLYIREGFSIMGTKFSLSRVLSMAMGPLAKNITPNEDPSPSETPTREHVPHQGVEQSGVICKTE